MCPLTSPCSLSSTLTWPLTSIIALPTSIVQDPSVADVLGDSDMNTRPLMWAALSESTEFMFGAEEEESA